MSSDAFHGADPPHDNQINSIPSEKDKIIAEQADIIAHKDAVITELRRQLQRGVEQFESNAVENRCGSAGDGTKIQEPVGV